jgi:hypothetical protein
MYALLLVPLILAGLFVLLFGMAWLEPKPKRVPSRRQASRRTTSR